MAHFSCSTLYIGVYNTYLHGECFLSALYNDITCHTPAQSTLLFVSSDSTSHALCHFSKLFVTHRPTSHFLQKYIVLLVCFCKEHIRHLRCFSLEGQCCECFTSNRLKWDAAGLGLPLEIPLAITFSSCEWIINLRMRIVTEIFVRHFAAGEVK